MARDASQLSYFAPRVLRRMVVPVGLIVSIGAAGLLFVLVRDRANDRQLARQAADDLGKFQKAIIEREIESAAAILLQFAEQQILTDFIVKGEGRDVLEAEYVRVSRLGERLDQIRLIGLDGRERVRIEQRSGSPVAVPEHELQSKSDRYYFHRTRQLERAQVYLSSFDLNVERGVIEEPWKPVLRLATPIFDPDANPWGILVLNYLGARILEPLAKSATQLPGWTTLVNRDGYYLEAPSGERSWGFMFGRQPTFAQDYGDAWKALQKHPSGNLLADHGMFTHHVVTPILRGGAAIAGSDLGLTVVSFIPNAALYAHSRAAFARIAAVAAFAALLLVGISWRLARAGAVHEMQELEIAASEQRLRVLSTQLIDLQEKERKSISRDLHDEVGQLATAITIDLKRARKAARGDAKDALIEHAIDEVTQLLDSMHRIAHRVRSSVLDDLGLRVALQSCCEDFEERTGIDTIVDVNFRDEDISEKAADNVYRCVQEALNNISRHANAERVTVRVWVQRNELIVRVSDRGVGFNVQDHGSDRLGLLGMRERAELLGGSFSIASAPDRGTEIEIKIPRESNESNDSRGGVEG